MGLILINSIKMTVLRLGQEVSESGPDDTMGW